MPTFLFNIFIPRPLKKLVSQAPCPDIFLQYPDMQQSALENSVLKPNRASAYDATIRRVGSRRYPLALRD